MQKNLDPHILPVGMYMVQEVSQMIKDRVTIESGNLIRYMSKKNENIYPNKNFLS